MSIRDDTLASLNVARDDLTDRIVAAAGSPTGSPAWQQMMLLVHRRDQIGAQIDAILGASFDEAVDGLSDAVAKLQTSTGDLKQLQKTVDAIGDVVSTAGAVVQAAAQIIALAAGA
jgi:hypothetical protein